MGEIGPVMIGRDHHDVSGTDSPYRETANLYDGSRIMSEMAHHSWVGDAVRGMTLVVLSNGGGVGVGKAINGGFGLFLDGSARVDDIIRSAVEWDVMGGIARRAWGRNDPAVRTAAAWNRDNADRGQITLPHPVERRTGRGSGRRRGVSAAGASSRSRVRLGVLAALGAVLVLTLGGCRAAAPTPTETAPATATTTAPPPARSSTTRPSPTTGTSAVSGKTGGVLRVGAGVTTSADPLLAATATDEFVAGQVFEALTSTTGEGRVTPLLATSWASSTGGRAWVFDLRPGVRFHDGRVLEAADVVATFDRLIGRPPTPEVEARFAGILAVIALDAARVEFILRDADPLFPRLVADPRTAIRARPATTSPAADGGRVRGREWGRTHRHGPFRPAVVLATRQGRPRPQSPLLGATTAPATPSRTWTRCR